VKTYIGTKVVQAKPMTRGAYNALKGWQLPADEDGSDEGFLVGYSDTYLSWSPKATFDEAYRETTGLTFGLAVEALKKGFKVARAGWNGKGMFVYLVPAASYAAQTGVAKSYFGAGSFVPYNAYMAIKNVDDTVSTWVPSINDCLAEDWAVTA
jgi:hypothetical protein